MQIRRWSKTSWKNSLRKLVALIVCISVLSACGDNGDPAGPVIDVTGTYNLQTVNGAPLPYTLVTVAGVYRLVQLSGTLTLNADRTYVERDFLRETIDQSPGAQVTDTTVVIRGTWEQQDSALVLTPTSNPFVLFGLAGMNRLTLSWETSNDSLITYVYTRAQAGTVAGRALTGQRSSAAVSESITRRLMTTSSMTGLRSTTTSSATSSPRVSATTSVRRASSSSR